MRPCPVPSFDADSAAAPAASRASLRASGAGAALVPVDRELAPLAAVEDGQVRDAADRAGLSG